MFTMSVIFLPVYPFQSPKITLLEKALIFLSAFLISGLMSLLFIRSSSSELLLKAVCNTALSSVTFMTSPEKYLSIASFNSTSFASSTNKSIVFCSILFLEKSKNKSLKFNENFSFLSESILNASLMEKESISAK